MQCQTDPAVVRTYATEGRAELVAARDGLLDAFELAALIGADHSQHAHDLIEALAKLRASIASAADHFDSLIEHVAE